MNSVPSAAEYSVPNHRVSAVDKGSAGGAGGPGGDRVPPEFCDSKKTTEIEIIDRQYVTTNSPEFEKISTAVRIDIPESSSRC